MEDAPENLWGEFNDLKLKLRTYFPEPRPKPVAGAEDEPQYWLIRVPKAEYYIAEAMAKAWDQFYILSKDGLKVGNTNRDILSFQATDFFNIQAHIASYLTQEKPCAQFVEVNGRMQVQYSENNTKKEIEKREEFEAKAYKHLVTPTTSSNSLTSFFRKNWAAFFGEVEVAKKSHQERFEDFMV